jgi:hypothetical protein
MFAFQKNRLLASAPARLLSTGGASDIFIYLWFDFSYAVGKIFW